MPLVEFDRLSFRHTKARVDLSALAANFSSLQKRAGGSRLCAVVKADAYGHGMARVAAKLAGEGCELYAVSSLDEGLDLRNQGITSTVLVLFGIDPVHAELAAKAGITPVVSSLGALAELEKSARAKSAPLGVHLNFDTGMGRMGLFASQAGEAAEFFKTSRALKLAGVTTHFARAGESLDFSRAQLARFEDALATLKSSGLDTGLVHAANSAAAILMPEARFDAVRAGIALYGVEPEPGLREIAGLRPVLEWATKILYLRRLPQGSPVSYGGVFVTQRPSLIATLPVGYADGFRRGLGEGRADVLVNGRRAPVVGRVCMDLCMADVTGIEGVGEGDEAVLLGRRGDEEISAEEMAAKLDTIGYEILCGIGKRVPRVYQDNG